MVSFPWIFLAWLGKVDGGLFTDGCLTDSVTTKGDC